MKLFLILFFPLITFGQKNCIGKIIDKNSGAQIPYATVGLVKENKGVSADEHGQFSIFSSISKFDSLRISSVGYETILLPVAVLNSDTIVRLERAVKLLTEIIVSIRPKELHIVNRFKNCSSNWYWIALETMSQRAQRFEVSQGGMRLNELEICKDASDCVFRVRIYDVDSVTEGPSKDLADTVIEIRSKESHLRIDLEKYDIIIPGKSFFVAIEWIFIPFNEELQKNKIDGKKSVVTVYKPALRFVNRKDRKPGNLWELNFNGRWQKSWVGDQNINFQITAKLK